MVELTYKTNNPRWGLSGMGFQSWESYSFTLGYLSNPGHYNNHNPHSYNADISVHIEYNNKQGAWDKEGRIHYYGSLSNLRSTFKDLFACSSAGTGNITKRVNSNGYILSLISDYDFDVQTRKGYTTANVFPPKTGNVENHLKCHLISKGLSNTQISNCVTNFRTGYGL